MSAIQWPDDIPQSALIDGYDEEINTNTAEFTPEVGDPLMSLRASEESQDVKFNTLMTYTQYDSLKAWRRTTLKSGTLPFQRKHPRNSSVTITALFTSLGSPQDVNGIKCIVPMEMLITLDS